MVQYARPTSDVTVNSWTATPLFEKLDEVTYSDADYIERNAVAYCEVGLSSVTDPVSSADHYVRYRLGRSRTDRTLTMYVRLYQGSTEIASWEHIDADISFVGFERTLSGAQADAITNYADLRLRFDITALQNTQVYGQVSWAEMAVPDAGAGTDALDVSDLALGTPTVDDAVFGQEHALDVSDLALGTPTVDDATFGQIHALDVSDLALGTPTTDTPALSLVHTLAAAELTLGTPTVDDATFGQEHALDVSDLALGTPTVDDAVFGQEHALDVSDLALGTPTMDAPAIADVPAGTDALDISDFTLGTPTLDAPVFGQAHALDVSDLALGTPTTDTPALSLVHTLAAAELTLGTPTVDDATFGQEHALDVSDLALGTPTTDTPALSLVHTLAAAELTLGTPTVDDAVFGQEHALDVSDLALGTPTVDDATFGQIHALDVSDLALGTPTMDTPAITDVPVGTDELDVSDLYLAAWIFALPRLWTFSSEPGERIATPGARERTVRVGPDGRISVDDGQTRIVTLTA